MNSTDPINKVRSGSSIRSVENIDFFIEKFKEQLQICQNKCIRFCLFLGDRSHIGPKEFEQINWLPVNTRFEQCVTSHVFKQQNHIAPTYMNELFKSTAPTRVSTRSSTNKLVEPP